MCLSPHDDVEVVQSVDVTVRGLLITLGILSDTLHVSAALFWYLTCTFDTNSKTSFPNPHSICLHRFAEIASQAFISCLCFVSFHSATHVVRFRAMRSARTLRGHLNVHRLKNAIALVAVMHDIIQYRVVHAHRCVTL